MLIHKHTLGAVSHVWNADGTRLIDASFRSVEFEERAGLIEKDWWYVPSGSRLAGEIACCYPDFDPVTDEQGNLVEIRAHYAQRMEARRQERQKEIERLKAEAKARGYEREFQCLKMQGTFGDAIGALLAERAGMTQDDNI